MNQFYLTRSICRIVFRIHRSKIKNWVPKWCFPSQVGMNIWNMKCQVFPIAFLPIVGLSQYSRVPWKSTYLLRNEGPVKHFIIQHLEVEQQHVCNKCCTLQEILNANFSFEPWKAKVLSIRRETCKQGLLLLSSHPSMLCPQHWIFPSLAKSIHKIVQ